MPTFERSHTISLFRNPLTGKGQSNDPNSGGTPALAWSAPAGLADGNSIIISSDTHTFFQPDKLAFIGFGSGWMASASENEKLTDHTVTTVTGAGSINAEYAPELMNRAVYTLNGVKYLRSLLSGQNATIANAGFINYDTGIPFAPLDHSFMYSRARIQYRAEDVGKAAQFKQDRIGANTNIDGDEYNSCYVKQDAGSGTAATDCYEGIGGARAYYFGGGVLSDGYLTDFAWSWVQNTPDGTDGAQYCITAKNGAFVRDLPHNSTAPINADRVIQSTSALRPQIMKWQDYLGNNNTVIDCEVLRGDMFMQLNGTHFFIADNSDPALCTMFCPLVPISFNGGNNWTFRLWKGQMSDYQNKAIFMLDSSMNLIAGVNI